MIDLKLVRLGMKFVKVTGKPWTSERKRLIDEAIARFQSPEGSTALKENYLGFKNYAGFGDQRCDCQYGYGPSHGNIVFSVERMREFQTKEFTQHEIQSIIYYLLAERDFQDKDDNRLHKTISEMCAAEQTFQSLLSKVESLEENEYMKLTAKVISNETLYQKTC